MSPPRMSLGFLCLTRDAGPGFWALAEDIAALARPGDQVVLVDDGSRDDTAALIGRFTAMQGWGAGVAVTRIVTATRGAGDLGIAANLALDAARADHVIVLPGTARLERTAFAAARTQAEAGDLDLLLAPPEAGPPALHRMILHRRLLQGLRCDEGRAAHGDLALLWQVSRRAARRGVAGAAFATASAVPDGPALLQAATALLSAEPEAESWLLRHLPAGLAGNGPGAVTALLAAAAELARPLTAPPQDPLLAALCAGDAAAARAALQRPPVPGPIPGPMPVVTPLVGGARLRIACEGLHARRMPFAYPHLAPLWADRVTLTEAPTTADLILYAHPGDLLALRPDVARAGRKTFALLSEEPFWDTLFSPDPLAAAVTLRAAHLGGLGLHQVNHHTSALYDFARIPYFLLTEPGYIHHYARLFARNAALTAADWQAAFAARAVQAVFMAERRPEEFHDRAWPAADVQGLCAWRTRLAEGYDRGVVERLGASWEGGPGRFEIPDWHADKIARLDGRARIISAIENTHQPTYVSEKIFDAFACGGLPLYVASPGHRLHDLGLEGAFVNLWGLSSAEAIPALHRVGGEDGGEDGGVDAAAYARAQGRLAALFTDPALVEAERARLRAALMAEVTRLADLGPL